MIQVYVPVVPVAQPRQRTRVMQLGGRAIARNYTPTNSPANATKATIKLAVAQVFVGPVLTGPVSLRVVAVFPRPASRVWKKRAMPREWKPSKPDGDNVAKLVLDAMNKLVWRDDSQVVLLEVLKMIAAGDEQPHLEITITEVNDEAIPAQKRV